MSMIFFIFIIVLIVTSVVATTIGRFTNKTIDKVMDKTPRIEDNPPVNAPVNAPLFQTQAVRKASDKDIIDVAVASQGKVTPTTLCAKLDISIDEATARLEELHNKGIFELENTESGHLVYKLVDLDLLR